MGQWRMGLEYTCYQFSQANQEGEGQEDLTRLLRRVADSIEGLGPVIPLNMVMELETNAEGFSPVITLYYDHLNDE